MHTSQHVETNISLGSSDCVDELVFAVVAECDSQTVIAEANHTHSSSRSRAYGKELELRQLVSPDTITLPMLKPRSLEREDVVGNQLALKQRHRTLLRGRCSLSRNSGQHVKNAG